MTSDVALSFSTSPELAEQLQALARDTGRTQDGMLTEALENHLDLQRWQMERIRQGMEEIDRGETIPHEAVEKCLASWGTDNELTPPA